MARAHLQHSHRREILADKSIVSDEQMQIFARVLFFDQRLSEGPTNQICRTRYQRRVTPLVEQLVWPLSKPSLLQKLLLLRQVNSTHLCELHEQLNGMIVHSWFKMLSLEVGKRLEALRMAQTDDVEIQSVISALTDVRRVWLESDTGLSGSFQRDRCEACILAQVASDEAAVLALRAAVKSRQSREQQREHPSRLRLLRLINGWLSELVTDPDIVRANTELSERMYALRYHSEASRHHRRRGRREQHDEARTDRPHCLDHLDVMEEAYVLPANHEAEHETINAREAGLSLASDVQYDSRSASEQVISPNRSNHSQGSPTADGPGSISQKHASIDRCTPIQPLVDATCISIHTQQFDGDNSSTRPPLPKYDRKPVWVAATTPSSAEKPTEYSSATAAVAGLSLGFSDLERSEQSFYHNESKSQHLCTDSSMLPHTSHAPTSSDSRASGIGSYNDRVLNGTHQRKSYAQSWMDLCGNPFPSQDTPRTMGTYHNGQPARSRRSQLSRAVWETADNRSLDHH